MKTFGIIDDNVEYISVIEKFLSQMQDCHLVMKCASFTEAVEWIGRANTKPDLILLDILMPEMTGLQALPKLRRMLPEAEIIMMTVVEDSDTLIKAFTLGANGYLLKSIDADEFISQINIIDRGGAAMSPIVARKLIQSFSPQDFGNNGTLSKRSLLVLQMLADGYNYKTIASKLEMTIDGVRFHIKQIYRTLNVQSAAQAVKKYYEGNLPIKGNQ